MDKRVKVLVDNDISGNVIYVMRRDQRIHNNYCIEYAYKLSYNSKSKLYVVLPYSQLKLNKRQHNFVKEGLNELAKEFKKYNVYFYCADDIFKEIKNHDIKSIVTDFSPLRHSLEFDKKITDYCTKNKLFCAQVDAHNIVPYSCLDVYKRTSKSVKINLFKYFNKYNVEFEAVKVHKYNNKSEVAALNPNIGDFTKDPYFKGGYERGMEVFQDFLKTKYKFFAKDRNNPDRDVLSKLSPYVNFGQISAQYLIHFVTSKYKDDNAEFFVNEMFVWKETAEHFCVYESNYDNLDGALKWARDSLLAHKDDGRPRIYSKKELLNGETDCHLWNAAQNELRIYGKMHGYVRMYWAKQLLKWTKSPSDALKTAIQFNDYYSIDGHDPKGYVGIMWCICGTMDQGYKDQPITGKIRPMNPIKTKKYADLWNDPKKYKEYLKKLEVKR